MKAKIAISLFIIIVLIGLLACNLASLVPTQTPKATPTPTLPPYTLNCSIGAEEYSISIGGESGDLVTSFNNETQHYGYASNGQRETITLDLDRTLTYKTSNHTYTIKGQIIINTIQQVVVNYNITASGGAFGDTPQTCKTGDVGQANPVNTLPPQPTPTAAPTQAISVSIPAGFTPSISVPDCDQARKDGKINGNTYLCMVSANGDFIGEGKTWLQLPDGVTFSAEAPGNADSQAPVTINIKASDGEWDIQFSPAKGRPWVGGFYDNAQRYPFQESPHPGLSISGYGRGCNQLTGKFEILEMKFESSPDEFSKGTMQHFAANFEQHCDGGPALSGYIRYDSSVTP